MFLATLIYWYTPFSLPRTSTCSAVQCMPAEQVYHYIRDAKSLLSKYIYCEHDTMNKKLGFLLSNFNPVWKKSLEMNWIDVSQTTTRYNKLLLTCFLYLYVVFTSNSNVLLYNEIYTYLVYTYFHLIRLHNHSEPIAGCI